MGDEAAEAAAESAEEKAGADGGGAGAAAGVVEEVGEDDAVREGSMNLSDHPATHVTRFFDVGHLPERLRPVSAACGMLAMDMVRDLPPGPEVTAGLRKLLEARDCFVRAAVEGERETRG